MKRCRSPAQFQSQIGAVVEYAAGDVHHRRAGGEIGLPDLVHRLREIVDEHHLIAEGDQNVLVDLERAVQARLAEEGDVALVGVDGQVAEIAGVVKARWTCWRCSARRPLDEPADAPAAIVRAHPPVQAGLPAEEMVPGDDRLRSWLPVTAEVPEAR